MGLVSKLNEIGKAVGRKVGNPSATYTIDEMPAAIDSIMTDFPGPSPEPVEEEKITFIDYDGTVLYEFPLSAAKEMTSMPELPQHEGMHAVKWNVGLGTLKILSHGITVGATYAPVVDGAPDEESTVVRVWPIAPYSVTLRIQQELPSSVVVNWGDGSSDEPSETGKITLTHSYSPAGPDDFPYAIVLTPVDGKEIKLGHGTSSNGSFISEQTTRYEVNIGHAVVASYAFYISSGVNYYVQSITVSERTTIDQSSTSIYPFYGAGISSFTIPSTWTDIPERCFYDGYRLKNVSIPPNIVKIGNSAFSGCRNLKEILIPSSVTSIGDYAFQGCCSLRSVVVPSGVISIRSTTFSGCQNLESVSIPDSVTSIGSSAFSSCYRLKEITLPPYLTYIDYSAFNSCYSLRSISIPSTVKFGNTGQFNGCYSLEEINFPALATEIPSNFISGNTLVKKIVIPEGVVSTNNSSTGPFNGTYAIEEIVVPSTFRTNARVLCHGAYSLKKVTFSSNMNPSMGFEWLTGQYKSNALLEVDFSNATEIPAAAAGTFASLNKYIKFIVPPALYEEWKSAQGWNEIANQIVAAEEDK